MKKRGAKATGAFLLTVGDEILDGRIQNTNASWFGEQLRFAGVPVSESRSVPDQVPAIVAALHDASAYPVVIVTGGLGPTNDDRTLESAAAAFGLKLGQTKESLKHIRDRYRARNLPLTPTRLKMALVPRGAKVLANKNGTAPGLQLHAHGAEFFFLPGPPHECRPIFEKHVAPFAKKALRGRRILRREFWRTFGRGESEVYQRVSSTVEALEQRFPEAVTFGVHITFPYIDLTLEVREAKAGKQAPKKEIDAACKDISIALGYLCFSHERESLADVVARLLKQEKQTVATAESCTGGMLGKMLTDVAGSSEYYLGGVVSYANSAKENLLGVNKKILQEHGAVSEASVRAMAEGMRKRLGSDFALAISGVAGPGGGSETKPVGTTYVALATRERTRTMHQVILHGQGSRDQNRVIATHIALQILLDAVRAQILGFHDTGLPVN